MSDFTVDVTEEVIDVDVVDETTDVVVTSEEEVAVTVTDEAVDVVEVASEPDYDVLITADELIGAPGPQGPEGPQGPPGPPGAGSTMEILIQIPATSHLITHNLGARPAVTVIDTLGREIETDVEYVDLNSLRVSGEAEFAGTVILN